MIKMLSKEDTQNLKKDIEAIAQKPELLQDPIYQKSVFKVLRALENGGLRVASPAHLDANCGEVPMENLETWVVHAWVKDAILLAMKSRIATTVNTQVQNNAELSEQDRVHFGKISYHDKFDMQANFAEQNVRALPGALVREGSHVSTGAIVMPSFVNLGAWVGANTMVDTWATVGSCAQIGKNVHIAGGVGIGGVLEPSNARPILIGDNAFIGSRVIVVEGVVIGEGAVLGANCCLTLSTPIYDVTGSTKIEYRGVVPPHAVVVPGTRMKEFPGGAVPLSCCYIIDYRNKKQNEKLKLNDTLRTTSAPIQTPLIVVPTYNEVNNIEPLLHQIEKNAPHAHILFVDDGSKDGTATIIKSQPNFNHKIFILERPGKLGLGSAYIAGFKWGIEAQKYDAICQMDADLSHNPTYLSDMFLKLSESDLVIGSRYIENGGVENWSLIRKFISRFGSWYGRTVLSLNIKDLTGGFNFWRTSKLKTINLDDVKSEGYSFQIELKYNASKNKFKIAEFPITFKDRVLGKSKMSLKICIEAFYRVIQMKYRRKDTALIGCAERI